MGDVRFRLLTDEESIQGAQNACALFYDHCLPKDIAFDTGLRHAAVSNTDNSLLLVLSQRHPYPENPVIIRALVLNKRSALPHLARFLRDFTGHNTSYMQNVRIGGPDQTTVHVADGVTHGDVERTLRTLNFRTDPAGIA